MNDSNEENGNDSRARDNDTNNAGRFVAGGLGGFAARLLTHPIDTLKTRLQVISTTTTTLNNNSLTTTTTNNNNNNNNNANSNASRNNVSKGLYKGFGAVAVGAPIASGAYFLAYETAKKFFDDQKKMKKMNDDDDDDAKNDKTNTNMNTSILENALVGVIAQAMAGVIYTPVDVIKERMQVAQVLPREMKFTSAYNKGQDYQNAYDALKSILNKEGLRKGLMRGYWAQNFVWWPWSAAYFCTYEECVKRKVFDFGPAYNDVYISSTAASAFAAATLATVLTHPLDLCKTRVQTIRSSSIYSQSNITTKNSAANINAMTMQSAFLNVLRTDPRGGFGLYRGVLARILAIAPGSAISFYVFESLRDVLF